MKKLLPIASLLLALPALAQTAPTADAWAPLAFLEGAWNATSTGPDGKPASGAYEFRRELGGHALSRHTVAGPRCTDPADAACLHGDQLTVFQDQPGHPLKALYIDNEGHVIHYTVSTPAPNDVVFLSDNTNGPRFRLEYRLDHGEMAGKFQIQMPGQPDWHSYLEWSGAKR